jgi:hypothetical protein
MVKRQRQPIQQLITAVEHMRERYQQLLSAHGIPEFESREHGEVREANRAITDAVSAFPWLTTTSTSIPTRIAVSGADTPVRVS